MSEAFLSLGSNLGDRMGYLERALSLLSADEDITVLNVSSVYETDPVGYKDQGCFLNLVCRIETVLPPLTLLHRLQAVEQTLHRERIIRFGPRTIDVDILTYDDISMDSDELTIPHPRMHERAFVQVPLNEILKGASFPKNTDPSVRLFGEVPDNCWLKHP